MINIFRKEDCCGCTACVQKCPVQCISLKEDIEGFLYPFVNIKKCIECGLCEKVCPIIHQYKILEPLKVYAARNLDENIRYQSSSGGIFTFLAEKVLNERGVVFGARYDENWEVKHDFTENIEDLIYYRGSKYLQSRIEDSYQKIEAFLIEGRNVLFTGTPCQVAGLKRYLGREYDSLLTVDFVCHGVPSPGVWRSYLDETMTRLCDRNSVPADPISKDKTCIESVSFRNKCLGWKKYCFTLTLSATSRSGIKNTVSLSEFFSDNTFMKGFLANLYLRPSCYACPAKCGKSGSDITIGDLWGAPLIIGNEDDDLGTSLVLINKKVKYLSDSSCLWLKEIDYRSVLKYNPSIESSVSYSRKREQFYSDYTKGYRIDKIISKLTKLRLYDKVIRLVKRIVKRIKRIIQH